MLCTCSRPLDHLHLFSLLVHVVHLFVPLGSWALVLTTVSCARVVTTGSCCTLVLAPWFMCTCSHYWFMLYTCSRPLVHVHLFSLLFHVVHLFVPPGSWALVLTTVSCALVLTTRSCCTLVLAPWFMSTCSNYCFMCTCSHYRFMLYTCSPRPLVHVHLF